MTASTTTPTITAMMLVRDRADLVGAAVVSVLAQTERDFELVILDDGSVDSTPAVLREIAAGDDRVRLLRNEVSHGIPAARNQVLAAARGTYLATCDSDDVSRAARFERQRAALDANPELVGVGVRIHAFTGDETGRGAEPSWHWGLRDGRLPFAFPGAMLRTGAVRAVGGFDVRYDIAEDLHLAYRLAGAARRAGVREPFATVDEVLLDYRLHPGSITARRARTREWCTLKAQLSGARELGGLSPRGAAVIGQSVLRTIAATLGLRR